MLLMTFNTANDFIAPHDLVTTIDRSGAAIVGLQELSERNAAALEAAQLESLPYRVLFGEYINGKGLLSRYPIAASERFALPSGRSAIEAHVLIEGQKTTVFVIHPPPPDPRRLEVVSRLGLADVKMLAARLPFDRPTLVLGDFNFARGTRGYRLLRRAGLIDTYRVAGVGPGATYPVRRQGINVSLPRLLRLDYIWVSRHFVPLQTWRGPVTDSDHLPLLSRVDLLGH
jgi:endonuclease/exonuclease/phosphatase family metal-dependent hydrolase